MTAAEAPTDDSATQMIISCDAAIPMSDDAVLRANVYRPRTTDPVPAIVNMGPYGKDLPMSAIFPEQWAELVRKHPGVINGSSGRFFVYEVPDPERWIPHGYAIAHIDARGTGRSPGMWEPLSAREATDFAEAIEWLARQPWCNGKVAVMGVSFYAMAAWRVAERQPPHLAGVIPWYGTGDPYREAWRHGGILSNGFIDAWWYRWLSNQHGSSDGQVSPLTGQVTTGPEVVDDAALERLRADLPAQAREHHLDDGWNSAHAVDWSKVTVPFLSVGSWGNVGLHLRGNIEAFRHAASTEKWLMLVAATGSGVARFHDDEGIAIQRRFFDHYLKGIDNDWSAQPKVTYELPEPDGGHTTRTASSWPVEQTHWTRLYVDIHDRAMRAEPPTQTAQVRYWPTSNGVSFRTAAFEQRTEIVGPLALRLQISTVATDLDVFVSARVLDADGCVAGPAVARGWLRLSHRELDEKASTIGSPVLAHDNALEVLAGRRYGVDVELWPTSLVIPDGGRLLLAIQGCDAVGAGEFRHDDPDDRPNSSFANWTTLYSDSGHPSCLLVPVLGTAT